MISIVDYGMGNLGSIANMLKHLGVESRVVSTPDEIDGASKLILPGVGSFDSAMKKIRDSGLLEALNYKAISERVPILGICLGMQILTASSEEGELPGLAWIPAITKKIPARANLKIPHMGWNIVKKSNSSSLTEGFEAENETRFYFVHSYAVHVEDPAFSILRSKHGIDFDSGIQKDNIYGVQFHPEKSHRFGKKLFSNFIAI